MMKIKQLTTLPLWVRLVFYFLLLSVIILLLFQTIFNYTLQGHLSAYIEGREEALNLQILNSLAGYYETTGGWSGVQMPLSHAAISTNTRLLLYNAEGRLVGDTARGNRHMMMSGEPRPDLNDLRVYHFAIELDGSMVGELVIAHPLTEESSAWLQQDLIFRRALSRSIMWIGLAAVGTALLLGVFFSRRLSRPIEEMTEATDRITRGDYMLKLPSYQSSELNRLAHYINQLADHLKELEKLRKRSTADIAHELRTPLATLRSYVEAVQDGVLPADRKTLGILLEEIAHLTRVATGLDELTRAENTRADHVEVEPVEINRFLSDKVASFEPRYLDKGVELKLKLPEGVVHSAQDSTALRKIMSNLLDNAYRYTEPGGKVEIALIEKPDFPADAVAPFGENIPAAGELKNKFLIRVADTGAGISKEFLPYIFERFFRADPSREREQSRAGSGIGLALVKELVRAAGGVILVSSQTGRGTTFYIYLEKVKNN
jgi:two-component system, OmpR family, sensor histidine kinase BaeS